jgi:isopenicillin-N N-acyltransferase-like protein
VVVKEFPLIEVSGSAYERGIQHGRACGDLIRRYPGILRRLAAESARADPTISSEAELDDAELGRRALRFLPAIERFAPEQVEEIRGIAAGAEVPFELALLVNVRAEVFGAGVSDGGCTALALGRRATANGSIIVGQNQDQDPELRDLVVILRVVPENGPRLLMATFGGLIGYGGINSAGVGYVANALANSIWRLQLPRYPVKRALLEQENIAGCLEVFDRARVCSSENNLLVDREGLVDVELTPDGYEQFGPAGPEADYLVHTNHFRCAPYTADEQYLPRLPDSLPRLGRVQALVEERLGRLTLADVKGFFADHEGYPTSICRHLASGSSNAIHSIYSVIGEPDRGLLHVSAGTACDSAYATYSV